MNKELVEKIEKEIGTYSNDLTKSMAKRIARIASEHYGDKWLKIEEKLISKEGWVWVILKNGELQKAYYYNNTPACLWNNDTYDAELVCRTDAIALYQYEYIPQPPQQ